MMVGGNVLVVEGQGCGGRKWVMMVGGGEVVLVVEGHG